MIENFIQEDASFHFEDLREEVDSDYHSLHVLYLSFLYGFARPNEIVRFPLDITLHYSPSVLKFANPDSQLQFTFLL
jgi:hypothetical protein